MYVWTVHNEHGKEPVYRFPCQVRMYAKKNGFSVFDESKSTFDLIVFCKGGNAGFFAARREVE